MGHLSRTELAGPEGPLGESVSEWRVTVEAPDTAALFAAIDFMSTIR